MNMNEMGNFIVTLERTFFMTSQYIWVQDSDSLKKEQWRSDKRGIRYYTKHQVIAILLLPKSTFKAIMLDFPFPKLISKTKNC